LSFSRHFYSVPLLTLTFVSQLESIDLLNNPICENSEFKFLITNLLPQIKYINRAPLKVDANKYGYSQIADVKQHHLQHQQQDRPVPFPNLNTESGSISEMTFAQRNDMFPSSSSFTAQGRTGAGASSSVPATMAYKKGSRKGDSEEEGSLNHALSAETIGQMMHGGNNSSSNAQERRHHHQQTTTARGSHQQRSKTPASPIREETEEIEQLDSPPPRSVSVLASLQKSQQQGSHHHHHEDHQYQQQQQQNYHHQAPSPIIPPSFTGINQMDNLHILSSLDDRPPHIQSQQYEQHQQHAQEQEELTPPQGQEQEQQQYSPEELVSPTNKSVLSGTSTNSRLPWRKPPNPLPRNWNQFNQSIDASFNISTGGGASTTKKQQKGLSSASTIDFNSHGHDPAVNSSGKKQNNKRSNSSQRLRNKASFLDQHSLIPEKSSMLGGLEQSVSADDNDYLDQEQHDHDGHDPRHQLFRTQSTLTNNAGAVAGSIYPNRTTSFDPSTVYPIDSTDPSAYNPNTFNPHATRWLSPEINRRLNRSHSPTEEEERERLLRSHIALPFPEELEKEKKRQRTTPSHSPCNSPGRSVVSVGKYEKSSPTRSSFLWARSQETKYKNYENEKEKELSKDAWISMTEKQEKILDQLERSASTEDYHHQQQRRHYSRSNSPRNRKEKPPALLLPPPPSSSSSHHQMRSELDEENDHFSANETIGITGQRKITSSSEKTRAATHERLYKQGIHHFRRSSRKVASYTEKYDLNYHQPTNASSASVASSSPRKRGTVHNSSNNNNNSQALIPLETFLPAKEEKEESISSSSSSIVAASKCDFISPYQRFVQLKEKIDAKMDHDISKINKILGVPSPVGKNNSNNNGQKKVKSNYDYLKSVDANFNENDENEETAEQLRLEYQDNGDGNTTITTQFPQQRNSHKTMITEEERQYQKHKEELLSSLRGGNSSTREQQQQHDNMSLLSHRQSTVQSVPSYTSNILSLDSLPLQTPHSLLEREALRLSQEMELLKMKKLHEIGSSSFFATTTTVNNGSYNNHQNHNQSGSQQSKQQSTILQEITANQQKQLAYHLQFIQEMLTSSSSSAAPAPGLGQQADHSNNKLGGSNSMVLPSTAFLTHSHPSSHTANPAKKKEQSQPPPQVQQEQLPVRPAAIKVVTPSSASRPPLPHSSSSHHDTHHRTAIGEEKTSENHHHIHHSRNNGRRMSSTTIDSDEVLSTINSQFDSMQIEKLNFIEMNSAIEALKQNQLQSLQLLQKKDCHQQ
jgi:hypothetical protein